MGTTAAIGTYNLSLSFLVGEDAGEIDVLQSFDFRIEVADRLDAESATDSVSISVTNNGNRASETATWFYANKGFQTDLNDDLPSLSGDLRGNWFAQAIAPGGTRTDAHSEWRRNATTVAGTYLGSVGVIGGLPSGDNFNFVPSSQPTIEAQTVPEPASLEVVSLGLAGLRRRDRVNRSV